MQKRTKYPRSFLEFSDFLTESEDDASAVQIAQLQDELAHLRDSHKEERFIWILVVTFLLSCIIRSVFWNCCFTYSVGNFYTDNYCQAFRCRICY